MKRGYRGWGSRFLLIALCGAVCAGGVPVFGADAAEPGAGEPAAEEAGKGEAGKEEAKVAPKDLRGKVPDFPLTHRYGESWKDYFPDGTKKDTMYDFFKEFRRARFKELVGSRPPSAEGEYDPKAIVDYEAGKHAAFVYVPESYKPVEDEKWGVLIYLGGKFQDAWIPLLEKHKLIFASPVMPEKDENADSDVLAMALAMDTLATLEETFVVDDDRFVIGGEQNGGRVALLTAIAHYREFEAVFSFQAALVLQRTQLERIRDLEGRLGKGRGSITFYYTSETPFFIKKHLRKAAKSKLRVVQYAVGGSGVRLTPEQRRNRNSWERVTGDGGEHERILRTAVHWYQAGFRYRLFDDNTISSASGAEWLDRCLLWAFDEDVEGFEPVWDRYEKLTPPKK